MNKQQDLINIFNFLAEFLREEAESTPKESKNLLVEKQPEKSNKINNLDAGRIVDIIKKIDTIDKNKLPFDTPFMRVKLPTDLRDEQIDLDGSKSKVNSDEVNLSGNT